MLNPPAHTGRRSALRQFIDAVIEGRRRKARHELALYLEHHKHSLKDDVRVGPEHRPAAISRRSLQACIASLPLQSSLMSKTYLKSDHFNGGGSGAIPSNITRLVRGSQH